MGTTKEIDDASFKWFNDKSPQQWFISHFNIVTKCDMLLNKICEVFNKCTLDAREKSITGLLEGVKVYLIKSKIIFKFHFHFFLCYSGNQCL